MRMNWLNDVPALALPATLHALHATVAAGHFLCCSVLSSVLCFHSSPGCTKAMQIVQLPFSDLLEGGASAIAAARTAFMQPGLGILLVADAPLPAATLHETLDVADSLSQLPCDMMGREIQSRGLQSDVRRYGAGPRNTTSLTATLKYSTGRELPSVSCASPRGCENRTTLDALERIGSVMLTTGRLVAGLCDSFLDLSSGQLERSIALSGVAKARLVHYHAQATDPTSGETKPSERAAAADLRGLGSWQGWHCDYGLFTVLCSPRYRSRVPVDSTKDGAPAVVDAAPPPSAGLVLLSPGQPSLGTSPIPVVVHVPPGMLAVQVGEAAQVLSGGRLVAAPHCVARPSATSPRDWSEGGAVVEASHNPRLFRSTLILFLQPAWGDSLAPLLPHARMGPERPPEAVSDAAREEGPERGRVERGECQCGGAAECCKPVTVVPAVEAAASSIETVDGGVAAVLSASEAACAPLGDILPPLRERWVCGMTFAEFSQRTARAYYGVRGSQTPDR